MPVDEYSGLLFCRIKGWNILKPQNVQSGAGTIGMCRRLNSVFAKCRGAVDAVSQYLWRKRCNRLVREITLGVLVIFFTRCTMTAWGE